MLLGRNPLCDITFTSLHISRNHCQILRIPPEGNFVLKNTTVNSFTFVDNARLDKADALAGLTHGTLIALGVPIHLASEAHTNLEFVFLKVDLPNNLKTASPKQLTYGPTEAFTLKTGEHSKFLESLSDSSGESLSHFTIATNTKRRRRLSSNERRRSKKICVKEENPISVIDISSDDLQSGTTPNTGSKRKSRGVVLDVFVITSDSSDESSSSEKSESLIRKCLNDRVPSPMHCTSWSDARQELMGINETNSTAVLDIVDRKLSLLKEKIEDEWMFDEVIDKKDAVKKCETISNDFSKPYSPVNNTTTDTWNIHSAKNAVIVDKISTVPVSCAKTTSSHIFPSVKTTSKFNISSEISTSTFSIPSVESTSATSVKNSPTHNSLNVKPISDLSILSMSPPSTCRNLTVKLESTHCNSNKNISIPNTVPLVRNAQTHSASQLKTNPTHTSSHVVNYPQVKNFLSHTASYVNVHNQINSTSQTTLEAKKVTQVRNSLDDTVLHATSTHTAPLMKNVPQARNSPSHNILEEIKVSKVKNSPNHTGFEVKKVPQVRNSPSHNILSSTTLEVKKLPQVRNSPNDTVLHMKITPTQITPQQKNVPQARNSPSHNILDEKKVSKLRNSPSHTTLEVKKVPQVRNSASYNVLEAQKVSKVRNSPSPTTLEVKNLPQVRNSPNHTDLHMKITPTDIAPQLKNVPQARTSLTHTAPQVINVTYARNTSIVKTTEINPTTLIKTNDNIIRKKSAVKKLKPKLLTRKCSVQLERMKVPYKLQVKLKNKKARSRKENARPANIPSTKAKHVPPMNSIICKPDHGSAAKLGSDANFIPIAIKAEPMDVSDDENNTYLPFHNMYSQINEVILISSDDEDQSLNHSSSGFLSEDAGVAISSEDYDLDVLFEDDVLSQSGLLSHKIKKEIEKEGFDDSAEICVDNSIDDDDDWFPILSQNFFNDTDEGTEGKVAASANDNDESSQPVESTNSIDDDDTWFPILSENFYTNGPNDDCRIESAGEFAPDRKSIPEDCLPVSDDCKDQFPINNLDISAFARSESPMKDLSKVIKKVSNKVVSRTKQIDAQEAVLCKKRRKPKVSSSAEKNLSKTVNKCKTLSEVLVPKKDSSPKRKSDKKVRKSIKPHHSRGSGTSGIRQSLLKTHTFEPYREVGKMNHHKVSGSDKTDSSRQAKGTERVAKPIRSENISVQKRAKVDCKVVPKGIAKDSKRDKIQQLMEIDMFPKASTSTTFGVAKARPTCSTKGPNHPTKCSNPSLPQYRTPSSIEPSGTDVPLRTNSTDSTVTSLTKLVKRVTFAEKDDIRFIPPRDKTQENTPVRPDDRYTYNICKPYSPYEFVLKICSWNYDWLATYKATKDVHSGKRFDQLPPIVYGALPTLLLYESYVDYKNIFANLMYLEIWESIFKDWMKTNEKNFSFGSLVETNQQMTIQNRGKPLKFHYVSVTIFLNKSVQLNKRHPCMGCLVVIKHKQDYKYKHTIAYVEGMSKVPGLKPGPQSLRDCSPQDADTTLTLELFMAKNPFHKDNVFGNIVMISNLSYIRPLFKTYEALCRLPHSPLLPHMLKPGNPLVYESKYDQAKYLVDKMRLNEAQIKAVAEISYKCTRDVPNPSISMIHGPPGTGKTRTILALVAQINQLLKPAFRPDKRVLVCAPSNAAIDTLTQRLHKLDKQLNIVRIGVYNSMHADAKPFSFDTKSKNRYDRLMFRSSNQSVESEIRRLKQAAKTAADLFQAAVAGQWPNCRQLEADMIAAARASEKLQKQCINQLTGQERARLMHQAKRQVLEEAEIVCTTLSSCASGVLSDYLKREVANFACCIVDEAGQCKETEIWLPLMLKVTKLVLVGDHKQLPATILSTLAFDKCLHQSLFERLYSYMHDQRQFSNVIYSFTVQYRMHAQILSWPSKHFYGGRLQTAAGVTSERTICIKPYIVFDLKHTVEKKQDGGISNELEAVFIRDLFSAMEPIIRKLSIGVITPYQEQKNLLLSKLHNYENLKLTISTVDTFQGQERDVVLCSFVRANSGKAIGFVSDKQRLNVSLTRARRSCIIIGNLDSFLDNDDWKSLIEDAHQKRVVHVIQKDRVSKNELLNMILVNPKANG